MQCPFLIHIKLINKHIAYDKMLFLVIQAVHLLSTFTIYFRRNCALLSGRLLCHPKIISSPTCKHLICHLNKCVKSRLLRDFTHLANQSVGHFPTAWCTPYFLHSTHYSKGKVQYKCWLLEHKQANKNRIFQKYKSTVGSCSFFLF